MNATGQEVTFFLPKDFFFFWSGPSLKFLLVTTSSLFSVLVFWPRGAWDLSSLSRNWPCALHGKVWSEPLGHQGSPSEVAFQASAKAQRKPKAPESLHCTKSPQQPSLNRLPRRLPSARHSICYSVTVTDTINAWTNLGILWEEIIETCWELGHRGWNSWTGDGVDYEVSGVRCYVHKEAQWRNSVEKKEEKLSTGWVRSI